MYKGRHKWEPEFGEEARRGRINRAQKRERNQSKDDSKRWRDEDYDDQYEKDWKKK